MNQDQFKGAERADVIAKELADYLLTSGQVNFVGSTFTITGASAGCSPIEVTVTTHYANCSPYDLMVETQSKLDAMEAFKIDVEKMLCEALGFDWTPFVSCATLIEQVKAKLNNRPSD